MDNDQLKALFDQQAAGYDARWARTAPIRDALHLLLGTIFADLPPTARVLCVGAGTGEEVFWLARHNPGWQFVLVEPSGAMLDICRSKAAEAGVLSRCCFHQGYLDSLAPQPAFDAATCFLVSQFITERAARVAFFAGIAARLAPAAVLASSDLSADTASAQYERLLRAWVRLTSATDLDEAGLAPAVTQMRASYARDVAVLPPAEVAAIIEAGGFEAPVAFYRAGLIQAWFARRVTAT